jgi:ribose-phosphate pyrophosphokinase
MAILFYYPDNSEQAMSLASLLKCDVGKLRCHHFPDGETLIQIDEDVKDKEVIFYCSLDRPDNKTTSLMFFAQTAKELGARQVRLVSPYLGYMRQDKRFHSGEAVTSNIYAEFISNYFDSLVTIDPHLHRHKSMGEIYTIPTKVIHAANAIANWIKENVQNPVLIGPDEESSQWVSEVAKTAGAVYTVLNKVRHGDKDVEVSVPEIEKHKDYTPVLVDDIISTARTMIKTVEHLKAANTKPPICIGVHAVFAEDAYEKLKTSFVEEIITCNTIPHHTNKIDINYLVASYLTSQ